MNMIDTNPGTWYCFFCTAPATVTAEIDGEYVTLAVLDSEGKESFCAPAESISIETDGKFRVLPTKASAGTSGGGYFHSNLNVGHGASAAAAAQCTLTLGDLATGGTLADSNGQSVELEAPHKYAEGSASFLDATAAGTLTIGEWSKEWEAQPGSYAFGYFLPNMEAETQLGGTLKLMRGEEAIYSHEFAADETADPWTLAAIKAELEADPNWECEITSIDGEIDFNAPVAGASWNDVELVLEGDLFGNQYYGGMSGGGEGARAAVDVFNDIRNDENCPVDVSLDADEQGLGFTAKEYGVNDTISAVGDMFSNWSGMSGGHGDYTVADLVTAIEGEFEDITPAAGEVEGTITLTADTPGADANAIIYTASGCFGSGTVKQGSTTRGRNAVAQTDYEVILNGGAPQPLDLASSEPLKNGHVYTLAVTADTDLSALTVKQYATCELWLDYTAGSVTWPQGLWWADGSAPTLAAGKSYAIALRNDGVKLRANVQYEDTTPAQS